MTLITLVYVSFATKPMSNDELREILEKSRDNNAALDVTGMLLYRDGFFIQALEGEEETVTQLYNKIKDDPRHRNCLQVFTDAIRKRSFGEWAMGFNKFDTDSLEQLEGYTNFLNNPTADFFADNPSHVNMLLHQFRHKIAF